MHRCRSAREGKPGGAQGDKQLQRCLAGAGLRAKVAGQAPSARRLIRQRRATQRDWLPDPTRLCDANETSRGGRQTDLWLPAGRPARTDTKISFRATLRRGAERRTAAAALRLTNALT